MANRWLSRSRLSLELEMGSPLRYLAKAVRLSLASPSNAVDSSVYKSQRSKSFMIMTAAFERSISALDSIVSVNMINLGMQHKLLIM